jgi:hypothetical protein
MLYPQYANIDLDDISIENAEVRDFLDEIYKIARNMALRNAWTEVFELLTPQEFRRLVKELIPK